jgi:hypothetical protein
VWRLIDPDPSQAPGILGGLAGRFVPRIGLCGAAGRDQPLGQRNDLLEGHASLYTHPMTCCGSGPSARTSGLGGCNAR